MSFRALKVAIALAVSLCVHAQSPLYGQCGGTGWSGATTCVAGSVCTYSNPYYSQCLPGTATSTVSSTTKVTTTSTASGSTSTDSGFVKTSGQGFTLNGSPYVVAGTNAYWLAQYSNADIDQAFQDIVNAGLTTVRTWGFNDVTSAQNYGAYYQSWSNGVATFNTGNYGISRFDYVVQSAAAHGVRLIVPLVNNWSNYGGMDVYVTQLAPGSLHDAFYTNSKIITAYKNYINEFVSRYVDSPAILGWELANEPRCSSDTTAASSACVTTGATITSWAQQISSYIKSIDGNHLVGMGDEGWFENANPISYPYAPGVGINFTANLEISSLDFGTLHLYPESWGQTANETDFGLGWISDHAAVQKQQNKPVIVEEFGVTNNPTGTYPLWWNEIDSSGLTGYLLWQAGSVFSDGTTANDGFAVYPTSAVYPLQKTAASNLKAARG